MRVYVLYILIAACALYAWRDWFVSLCGLIVLTAVMGHPDMPRNILGIQGLNPWNVLFVAVAVPWLVFRRQQGLRWDLPWAATMLFCAWLLVTVIAFARAAADFEALRERMTFAQFTSDYLVNALKYVAPSVLLFDGCRTRQRVIMGLCAALLMVVIYSLLITRIVPVSALRESDKVAMKQRKRIGNRIGFHANAVALVCVAGFWGTMAAAGLRKRRWHLVPIVATAALIALALGLTLSRAGYLGFVGVGMVMAFFLWRRLLVLFPIGLILICLLFPGIPDRISQGFGVTDVSGAQTQDMDVVSAGRTTRLWPPTIDAFLMHPMTGWGRLSIFRSPAYEGILMHYDKVPIHPHNAYLELLCDSGLLGFVPVMALYGMIFIVSAKLCRDNRDPMFRAVGGAGLAAVSALLIMSLSGQSLFPRENGQMSWCFFAIVGRLWIERRRYQHTIPMRGGAGHP